MSPMPDRPSSKPRCSHRGFFFGLIEVNGGLRTDKPQAWEETMGKLGVDPLGFFCTVISTPKATLSGGRSGSSLMQQAG